MKPPFHTPLTVPEHPGDYFPNMPLVRDRGIFDADMSREDSRLIDCKKMATRHPSLIPGVFTLFCGHGVCLGFAIMEQVESVEVPFRILRTRFQKCPELVVYDNACQLHTYALRRDPHFVKDSRFLVDRLHWRNHSDSKCTLGQIWSAPTVRSGPELATDPVRRPNAQRPKSGQDPFHGSAVDMGQRWPRSVFTDAALIRRADPRTRSMPVSFLPYIRH
ncbi:hypothetical protein ACEWY4_022593 [Coilia grayii]|uniref:Uncharacterized protein n=1 Tax=Coilia grayii TaxID=363190 RepID=A0ABD1J6F5_9TELE